MSLKTSMNKIGAKNIRVELLSEEKIKEIPLFPTALPILNIALSGDVDGGLSHGLSVVAGPSKHFKSLLGLVLVKAYIDFYKAKFNDNVFCVYYDTEGGVTDNYIESVGIDPAQIYKISDITHIEQLKFDIVARLKECEPKTEKVIFFIDSIGNLASNKEVEDAENEKIVADMTRAKAIKSLFRLITPILMSKQIPCVAINHTYATMELYSRQQMSGGSGILYAANQVLLIGKSQEKEEKELIGNLFTINIEKSRFVKEKSKFTFTARFNGGIDHYAGLFELLNEQMDLIKNPKTGWYSRVKCSTGEVEEKLWRKKDTNTAEFWNWFLKDETFKELVKKKYQLGYGSDLFSQEFESDDFEPSVGAVNLEKI